MSSAPRTINSLWVGDRLGFIERLCVQSALATGHGFRLFSYEPSKLKGVPAGVEKLTVEKLYAAGLGRLSALLSASALEISRDDIARKLASEAERTT